MISAVQEASPDDEVRRAEARVVVVMVDVEDVGVVALEEVDRHAIDVPAVEEHDRALARVGGKLVHDVLERKVPVLVRQREVVRAT